MISFSIQSTNADTTPYIIIADEIRQCNAGIMYFTIAICPSFLIAPLL
jgi:hypothetical protein